jgi:zinc transporter
MTASLLYFSEKTEKPHSLETFYQENKPDANYWLHFSADDPTPSKWLQEKSGIDPILIEPMLAKKVRPRLVAQLDSLLLILRVPDTLKVSEYEELRSLRIYADQHKIISTSLYPLPVVEKLLQQWKAKPKADMQAVDLLMDLSSHAIRGLEVILEDLEDQTDTLEKQVLDVGEDPSDKDITTLALDGLHVRRCLAPQREVFSQLNRCELTWLTSVHSKRTREIYERVSRQLEETEVIRDRTRIIREQLNSHIAEQANHRLYIFSVVAAVFIPLSFLTGLFGVNLGGIPGAETPLGFASFCAIILSLTLSMIFIFKRLKWL